MPASEATVETAQPGRYLTQMCQHASKMGTSRLHRPRSHSGDGAPPEIRHAEWSATDGTVTLNWGQWTMHAGAGTLTLRAEAGTRENLGRIQDLVTARLEKIGRRDRLAVNWQPAETPGDAGPLSGDSARSPPDRSMASLPGGPRRPPRPGLSPNATGCWPVSRGWARR